MQDVVKYEVGVAEVKACGILHVRKFLICVVALLLSSCVGDIKVCGLGG